MKFTKMHGLGNDFVVLDAVADAWIASRDDLPEIARTTCDRRTGVGADGLIVVEKDAIAGHRMSIYNADGSDGGMCGNGSRCIAKLLVERGYAKPDDSGAISVALGDRLLRLKVDMDRANRVASVTVDMGPPVTDVAQLPVLTDRFDGIPGDHPVTFVGMGNPHLVAFMSRDDLIAVDLKRLGPVLEHHRAFPERMNIQFAHVESPSRVRVRTWERGAGATHACGSGACAVVAAGVIGGTLERRVIVDMPGGELDINWDQATGHVFMSGPAAEVFTGDWPTPVDIDAVAAKGERVLTPRLILRRHVLDDAEAVRRAVSRFEVARYTKTMPHPYPPGAELQFLEKVTRGIVEGDWCTFAITFRDTGEVIGGVGSRVDPHNRSMAEVGYHLGMDHWGRGYATEALNAMVDHLFTTTKLEKLFARWYTANGASGRVLEKAGFTHEGTLIKHFSRWGEWFDVVCVRMLRSEWEARRAR